MTDTSTVIEIAVRARMLGKNVGGMQQNMKGMVPVPVIGTGQDLCLC
jgi:hypothetical protein